MTDFRRPALLVAVLAAVLVAITSGCAGTGGTTAIQWRDPSWQGPPIKNMLVLVVRHDPIRRRMWEDTYVRALQKRGMQATPSYRTFPDSVPSEEALLQVMKEMSFDGILLSRRTTTEERQVHVPQGAGTVGFSPWGGFWGTYQAAYGAGPIATERVVTSEVTVWDARKDGMMVWSGTTSTPDPTDAQKLMNEIVGIVVPRLKTDGVIP